MDRLKQIQEIVDKFLDLGFRDSFKAQYTKISDTELKINIQGENPSYLIGYRGKSLFALQHIIRQMYVNTSEDFTEEIKIIIDVDGYKEKRLDSLKELAKTAVEKCISINKEIALPVMTPFERHVIHSYIQELFPNISTTSIGEDPNRKIVIKPINQKLSSNNTIVI